MSAFIVAKQHVDALVTAAIERYTGDIGPLTWTAQIPADAGCDEGNVETAPLPERLRREATPDQAGRIGQMLVRENRLSVNCRYAECEIEDIYTFDPVLASAATDPVVILKAIDCYEYQSCEHPGWRTSEAHCFCQALRRRLIYRLPGYEAAPWEITSRRQFVRPVTWKDEEPC